MNLYLIGFRGSGKSTVGKMLAARLGLCFLDTDDEIEKRSETPISRIVSDYGWSYFRRAEKNLLQRVSALKGHVIATGGGMVCDSDNVWRMRQSGKIIWLMADVSSIEERILCDPLSDKKRPSLTGRSITAEAEEVLLTRLPLYSGASDIAVQTDGLKPEEVCDRIIAMLKNLADE